MFRGRHASLLALTSIAITMSCQTQPVSVRNDRMAIYAPAWGEDVVAATTQAVTAFYRPPPAPSCK